MTPDELGEEDIALLNLRCAEGLQGSEHLDVAAALKSLDRFADHVKQETTRNFHRYQQKPEEFENSEPYYRLMMMAIVLQEDGKVQYNPSRISTPDNPETNAKFFANAKDVFIHGLTGEPMMGTCASLPVFYAALGRRLGYPLRLVTTKAHIYVRWEDEKTRLNMEATARGFQSDGDEYYKSWPYKVSEKEIAENGYLKSLTPREELACFLSLRAACFHNAMRHYKPGIEAMLTASRLAPHFPGYRMVVTKWNEMLRVRQADQMLRLLDQAELSTPPTAR